MVLSQEAARDKNMSVITDMCLLWGLRYEDQGVAAMTLKALGVNSDEILEAIESEGGSPTFGSPPFTPRVKKILEFALREGIQLGHNYIGTEHILLALVREGEGHAVRWMVEKKGIDTTEVRQTVMKIIQVGHDVLENERKWQASAISPRRIIYKGEAPGGETGHDWQPLEPFYHPLVHGEVMEMLRGREEALRRLLDPPGAEITYTWPDGWTYTFKLESPL